MAQQKKQAQPDVLAITTASTVIIGSWPTAACAGPQVAANVPVVSASVCTEISQAIDLLNVLAVAVARIHRAARRRQPIDVASVKPDIEALIDSYERAPNALVWALAANRRMYYLCRRAVGSVVWALALGRRLEFDRAALHDLMLGALLLDIGKISVPVVILAKTSELNPAEQNFARRHVLESVRMLEAVTGLSEATIEMVRSHHERIDGSGYPFGLQGDEISLYAQIAGIVDTFDALSLSRYYAKGLSGHDALGTLQQQRGQKFAAELVDHLFAAIGEFPTGTWVELADGSIGVVCMQDAVDPAVVSGPQVALIADAKLQPYLAVRWLTLHKQSNARALPPGERPLRAAAMERSLQSAIYGRPRKH